MGKSEDINDFPFCIQTDYAFKLYFNKESVLVPFMVHNGVCHTGSGMTNVYDPVDAPDIKFKASLCLYNYDYGLDELINFEPEDFGFSNNGDFLLALHNNEHRVTVLFKSLQKKLETYKV